MKELFLSNLQWSVQPTPARTKKVWASNHVYIIISKQKLSLTSSPNITGANVVIAPRTAKIGLQLYRRFSIHVLLVLLSTTTTRAAPFSVQTLIHSFSLFIRECLSSSLCLWRHQSLTTQSNIWWWSSVLRKDVNLSFTNVETSPKMLSPYKLSIDLLNCR